MPSVTTPVIARHLEISGHVQGVWYRNWTVDTARALGLVGWVRNRANGNVEAWAEGTEEAVNRFLTLAHEGPPAARVAQISVQEGEPQGFTRFEKRPTG
jgi:acylphosphatase